MCRMDEWTDDILLCILSSLTMKDAANAGLVSRRWWNLYTILNFDIKNKRGYDSFAQYMVSKLHKKIPEFVNWVDRVLRRLVALIGRFLLL
ncbi:hypothetical protein JCGZ_19202 [Jatropha curcas]|uniref:F-box domain-containing protein n=1 Tax=Jatropha curcas TaxID=180498 RepID=A0A067LIB2_JATCU|nr:hypothetical protein JCGZ_19202 [Jatropha curcas]